MKDGGKLAHYMTVEDAKTYGKHYSKTYGSGPWQTDFDAMAKKSCLRQVLKYAPTSTDVDSAIKSDEHTLEYKPDEETSKVIDILDEDVSPSEDKTNAEGSAPAENLNVGDDGVAVDSETGEILGEVPEDEE